MRCGQILDVVGLSWLEGPWLYLGWTLLSIGIAVFPAMRETGVPFSEYRLLAVLHVI